MAFVAGFATKKEIEELTRRGWKVEPAEKYGLIGDDRLMDTPEDSGGPEEIRAVVVFADSSIFEIMDGPDWEK
jgi:hypothetical protein